MPDMPPSTHRPLDERTLPPEPPSSTSDLPTVGLNDASPSASVPVSGTLFGDYELLNEIGRGGMGVVFKARQTGLNRIVALKMILPGSLATDEDLQRFRTEAEATARLQHPHIVTVHAVGAVAGRHFYSMDFVDGPSLAQRLTDGPLPERVAARYLVAIARAIHHAHQQSILHRDLKPSNILLDGHEQPHVTDFGLAKRLGLDSGQTRTGAVLGTPSYMAPEQAGGRTRELGPACDVYGLGAILYECLTGRPPFRSDTPLDTLMHVVEREPAPPRLLNPKVSRDLETICLKCLEKEPRQRYATAEELALDLERFLADESINASTFNVFDRIARTLQRGHYDREVRGYGDMMMLFAGVVLLTHVVIFLLTWQGRPYPIFWIGLARTSQLLLMGGVFWYFRSRRLVPAGVADRQLWGIVLSFLLGAFLIVPAVRLLPREGSLDELELLPLWSVLSGMTFFALGSNYWGRCYAFSTAFFVAAMVMPFALPWSPLVFGVLWAVALAAIGMHLRRLGVQHEGTRAP